MTSSRDEFYDPPCVRSCSHLPPLAIEICCLANAVTPIGTVQAGDRRQILGPATGQARLLSAIAVLDAEPASRPGSDASRSPPLHAGRRTELTGQKSIASGKIRRHHLR